MEKLNISQQTIIENTPSLSGFSNVQRELLTLFSYNLPDAQLHELKRVIARFLMENAISEASSVWEEKGYSDDILIQEARSGALRRDIL